MAATADLRNREQLFPFLINLGASCHPSHKHHLTRNHHLEYHFRLPIVLRDCAFVVLALNTDQIVKSVGQRERPQSALLLAICRHATVAIHLLS